MPVYLEPEARSGRFFSRPVLFLCFFFLSFFASFFASFSTLPAVFSGCGTVAAASGLAAAGSLARSAWAGRAARRRLPAAARLVVFSREASFFMGRFLFAQLDEGIVPDRGVMCLQAGKGRPVFCTEVAVWQKGKGMPGGMGGILVV